MKQVFGRTLIQEGHTIDSDAAPIESGLLYNIDGGKVLPTDQLKRAAKRKQTKPKGKR